MYACICTIHNYVSLALLPLDLKCRCFACLIIDWNMGNPCVCIQAYSILVKYLCRNFYATLLLKLLPDSISEG